MKKQSNLSRLINYAGPYRVLVYLSWILSGVSAVLALLPFYFLWKIIQEILNVMPDFAQATELTYNGWMALITAVASMLIYIAGLMCSHIAAFRVQANLRKEMMMPYHDPASWRYGTSGKRQGQKNRQRMLRIDGNLSGSSAAGHGRSLCDSSGAYLYALRL